MEGRIRELETKLKFAKIINENDAPSDEVALGRTVVVREVGTTDDESYSLVGSSEADPAKGYISNESPVGRAVMGRKVNDVVEVKSPGGSFKFTIVRIE
jgi:transcription elongation factor GreA